MGSQYFSVFYFKTIILISLIMNFFTFQFLGVAMLIVNTFAAPLSEGEEERGETNQMKNGGEGEEERRKTMEDIGCPESFDKLPLHYEWHVLPTYKCFYLHKDSNGSVATQTFSQAVKTCGEKNSKVFEPTNTTAVKMMQKWLQSEEQKKGGNPDAIKNLWVNYVDIDMKASLIQNGAGLVDSKYMGSLSTLNKIPDDLWGQGAIKYSSWNHLDSYHCAGWAEAENGVGVYKWKCDGKNAVICEAMGSPAAYSLKKYLTNANYAGGEEERRGTDMMQNGKRAADETNMMQNGKRAGGPTNMMQNGKREEAPVIAKRHPGAGWEESERMEPMMC